MVVNQEDCFNKIVELVEEADRITILLPRVKMEKIYLWKMPEELAPSFGINSYTILQTRHHCTVTKVPAISSRSTAIA